MKKENSNPTPYPKQAANAPTTQTSSTANTQFSFEITQGADISIDIYTLSGLKVSTISSGYFNEGYGIVDWDGTDSFGQILSNGVYLFQMKASNDIQKINFTGRVAIIR